jgi:Kef-type K+ transport system membrane component KefB
VFGQLAMVVIAALLGPALAAGRRPLLPVLVGELAAGALIGRTGFRILDPAAAPMPALYAIGFAMLMLSVGTQVDLSSAQLRQSLSRGGLALLVSLAASLLLGQAISLTLGIDHALLFGILLAGISAAVVFPCIEERALSGSAIAFLTAWVVLADGFTVLLMPLTLIGPGHLLLALAGDALIIAAGAGILWLSHRAIRHEAVGSALREGFRQSRQRGWALQLRLSILILLVLAAIAEGTGASVLVAGFVAGVVLAQLGQPERLVVQLSGVANGFFVPAFFVLLGATLDLRQLVTDPVAIALGVLLAVGSVTVHLLGAAVAGQDRRFTIGLLASAQLGLPAAAAALGLSSHALSPALAAALVLGGCLTLIPTSVASALLARGQGSTRIGTGKPGQKLVD